jgi:CRP-like cAMP-binding protein
VAAGTVLVRQGHRPRQFVIVLCGTGEVWRDGQPIDEIGAGGYFGEIELIRRIGEPASVAARGAMTIDVIGAREFATLYADLAPVRRRLEHEVDRRVAAWLPASGARAPRARVPMVRLSSLEPYVRSELP